MNISIAGSNPMPVLEECSGEYKITSPLKAISEDDRVMEDDQTKERTGQFNMDEY